MRKKKTHELKRDQMEKNKHHLTLLKFSHSPANKKKQELRSKKMHNIASTNFDFNIENSPGHLKLNQPHLNQPGLLRIGKSYEKELINNRT